MTKIKHDTPVQSFAELRTYKHGWIARVRRWCLRYNKQDAYTELSVFRMGDEMKLVGGEVKKIG